jgi:hypothetical protein
LDPREFVFSFNSFVSDVDATCILCCFKLVMDE